MRIISRLLATGFLLISLFNAVWAQQTAEKFVREMPYLLALPEGYAADTTAKWPLLLFLHGSGESGNDLEKVKLHGPPELIAKGKKFPFVVVSPQSPVAYGWDIEMLYGLLQDVKKRYRVDAERVYLTGLSMGGFGTVSLAQKYPEEFAAIAPVCGGGDTSNAWKLRHTPSWFFHGAKDDVVPPEGSFNLVNAIRQYGKTAQLTIFPAANHNSWDSTYNSNDQLYNWFLAQKRFRFTEQPADPASFRPFEGTYAGGDKDTVQIVWTSTGLLARPPGQEVPLKYAGNQVFFVEPALPVELRFILHRNTVNGFLFMGNEKKIYRKIR